MPLTVESAPPLSTFCQVRKKMAPLEKAMYAMLGLAAVMTGLLITLDAFNSQEFYKDIQALARFVCEMLAFVATMLVVCLERKSST